MSTLYERIGGEAAVMAAVELFYKKVLADDHINKFFTDLDMAGQTKKQVAFMTVAFGGPDEYKGRDMREAHAHLVRDQGLDETHFNAVAGHLKSTLEELGVAEVLVGEALTIVAGTKSEVLSQ
jgi:hemoglobin